MRPADMWPGRGQSGGCRNPTHVDPAIRVTLCE